MVTEPGAGHWSPRLDVTFVDAGELRGGSLMVAFATAVRGNSGQLVLVARGDARPDLDHPAFAEQIHAIFTANPGVTCLALDGTDSPPLGPPPFSAITAVPPPAGSVPLCVVVRRDALNHLGALRDAASDPWVEVIERLGATPGAVWWSTIPGPTPQRKWSPPVPIDPTGVPLTGALDASAMPDHGELDLEELFVDRWVEVVRVRRSDGATRIAPAGAVELADDEEIERSLAFVHRAEFPAGLPLLIAGHEHPQRYPLEPAESTHCVGWLHPYGLPGGVALMVFHDQLRNDDLIGLAGDEHPGRHPARLLGWAMETLDPLPTNASAMTSDRLQVILEDGGYVAVAARSSKRGTVAASAIVSGRSGNGSRPLYGALANAGAVLTCDPGAPGLHDVALLGYVDAQDMVYRLYAPSLASDRFPPSSVVRRAARRARRSAVRMQRRRGEPPRTLVVAPWLSVGGGDHFLLALLAALRQRGFRVWIATTFCRDESPVDNTSAFLPHVEAVICLPQDRPGVSVETAVAKLVSAHAIDQVLLCGGMQLYAGLSALRAVQPHLRVIDQLYNDIGHFGNNRVHSDQIDLTICAYEALRDKLLVEHGEAPDRVERIYIGIDSQRFRPLPPERRATAKAAIGFDPRRPLWGFLGRVSEEKRLPDLIDALDLIHGRHDAQVLIQGEGPARDELAQSLTGREDLVELRPFAPDALPVLQALDVYILPSRIEGIPLAVMEAMACGALPVATAVGGVPELVTHGRTGYLASPNDPGSIANALLAVTRTPQTQWEAMTREARRVVRERMSNDQMVEDYVRLLSSPAG